MMSYEVNFDSIVGPTHNYSGLAFGNVASIKSKKAESNPKQAALQGLQKMKYLADLGCKQAVLPPHERPHIPTLKLLGYNGSDEEILAKVSNENPDLLYACSSASSMWAANAATVAPSADTADQRVHFTTANLSSKFHRSIESEVTKRVLEKIFADPNYFVHHDLLPTGNYFSDEGAANHTRFCKTFADPGLQLFVFGRYAFPRKDSPETPKIYPARQTYEASQAIVRRHLLNLDNVVFAQQNPEAIDAGVFHNDVISVGNNDVFLYHENAFINTSQVIFEIRNKFSKLSESELKLIPISINRLSLSEAVSSYLFNSQLITLNNEKMLLLAPSECQESPKIKQLIDEIIQDGSNPINQVAYFNVHESMRNGGGPGCLRLRIVLNEQELKASHPKVFLDNDLYNKLVLWVEKHYRDRLHPDDLADPLLLKEVRAALQELTEILELGTIYDFQC